MTLNIVPGRPTQIIGDAHNLAELGNALLDASKDGFSTISEGEGGTVKIIITRGKC